MRQVGILAAAASLALTDQVERLAIDHNNARYLAEQLSSVEELNVDLSLVQTNMVYAQITEGVDIAALAANLKVSGILISPSSKIRLVTHADISRNDIDVFIRELKHHFKK